MLQRDPIEPTLRNHLRGLVLNAAGALIRRGWDFAREYATIGPNSGPGRSFGSFGEGSSICFPPQTLVNPQCIHIGAHTTVAPDVALSAGWGPGHVGLPERMLVIGDRCLIGRGSSIVCHASIEIGDDVWTGHQVHITDMNHGYEDVDRPCSVQNQPAETVSIGAGSWLGHGTIVLPGSHIGRHVVVGANSVVTGDLPDFSVAVGVPAKVIRHHEPGRGWVDTRTGQVVGAAGARASASRPPITLVADEA